MGGLYGGAGTGSTGGGNMSGQIGRDLRNSLAIDITKNTDKGLQKALDDFDAKQKLAKQQAEAAQAAAVITAANATTAAAKGFKSNWAESSLMDALRKARLGILADRPSVPITIGGNIQGTGFGLQPTVPVEPLVQVRQAVLRKPKTVEDFTGFGG